MSAPPAVRLVPLGPEHLARTRAWANDPELMRLMDRAQPITEIEHSAWFASLSTRDDCAYFAIELDERRHVGNVWLWAIDHRHHKAELRIVVGDASARDHGVGREAIRALAQHAFDALGLHRVYAYVLAINPRAKRAFEQAGFAEEGLLRHDRQTPDGYVDAWLLALVAR